MSEVADLRQLLRDLQRVEAEPHALGVDELRGLDLRSLERLRARRGRAGEEGDE
jgi:hypothetical protein